MPKRDREHWGSLVPHNSLCGRRPVPLCSPSIVIGKDGDVTAPHNPHLSKHHIRLERVDDGSVYATHLSALNDTWLNGAKLERVNWLAVGTDLGTQRNPTPTSKRNRNFSIRLRPRECATSILIPAYPGPGPPET